MQDPRLRPSANTLIHHPFLSGPHDSGKLAELVQFQADQKRNAGGGGARPLAESHSRLPASKWDFDSLGRAARAQRAAKGTIKSHQINNFTMRDSTWGSTYAPSRLQSWVSRSTHPTFEPLWPCDNSALVKSLHAYSV